MKDLVAVINAALRRRGWSARQASLEAVGSDQFIRDMRRGRVPPVEKFRSLCEILDLEFYVGPKRELGSVDERRLEVAVATAERALESSEVELGPDERARVMVAIYALIGDDASTPANANRVARILKTVTGGDKPPPANRPRRGRLPERDEDG